MGVLDDMTRGITDRKAVAAGPNLTPKGLENSSTKPSLAALPNDVPTQFLSNELLADHRDSLRSYAADLLRVADGIDVMLGIDPAVTVAKSAATLVTAKLQEREADRRAADREKAAAGDKPAAKRVEDSEEFDARMKRLSDDAKAATFTAADAPTKAPKTPAPVAPATGWTCSEHGDSNIETLTSRLRPQGYMACAEAGCGEFEPK